jgi:hypothetical protein
VSEPPKLTLHEIIEIEKARFQAERLKQEKEMEFYRRLTPDEKELYNHLKIQELMEQYKHNETEFKKEITFYRSLTPDEKELYNRMKVEECISKLSPP